MEVKINWFLLFWNIYGLLRRHLPLVKSQGYNNNDKTLTPEMRNVLAVT